MCDIDSGSGFFRESELNMEKDEAAYSLYILMYLLIRTYDVLSQNTLPHSPDGYFDVKGEQIELTQHLP